MCDNHFERRKVALFAVLCKTELVVLLFISNAKLLCKRLTQHQFGKTALKNFRNTVYLETMGHHAIAIYKYFVVIRVCSEHKILEVQKKCREVLLEPIWEPSNATQSWGHQLLYVVVYYYWQSAGKGFFIITFCEGRLERKEWQHDWEIHDIGISFNLNSHGIQRFVWIGSKIFIYSLHFGGNHGAIPIECF